MLLFQKEIRGKMNMVKSLLSYKKQNNMKTDVYEKKGFSWLSLYMYAYLIVGTLILANSALGGEISVLGRKDVYILYLCAGII